MAASGLLQQPKPHLIAHRGGDLAGPDKENSIEAFRAAVDLGFKFLETDVILTKDNLVISYHGSQNLYMKRKSGLEKRKYLQGLTYEEINEVIHKGKQKVPLLEDLLNQFPKTFFSIDAKSWEVVEPLTEIIKKTNSQARVSITSFNIKRSLEASMLLGQDSSSTPSLCLYRFQSYPMMVFPGLIIKRLRRRGIKILHMPYKCVSRRILKAAHNEGVNIYAWSVNEPQDIKRLLGIGIDGIISDNIALLKRLTS